MSAGLYTQEQFDIGLLKQQQDFNNQAILNIEKRLDTSFASMDSTFNRIDKRMDHLEKEMRANFYWLLGVIGALGLIMAHGFKWF